MAKYIRTNLVDGEPMNLGAYNAYKGWTIPDNEDPNTEGFLVKYKHGYISWCPKDEFLSSGFKLESATAEGITDIDVDNFTDDITLIERDEAVSGTITTLPGYQVGSHFQNGGFKTSQVKDIVTQDLKSLASNYLEFALQWARFGIAK